MIPTIRLGEVWGRDEAWARVGENPVPKGKKRESREGKLAILYTERIHNLNPVRTNCELNPVCRWETRFLIVRTQFQNISGMIDRINLLDVEMVIRTPYLIESSA